MTETLTGARTPAAREAMAGAAPETAGAAPEAITTTPPAAKTAPPALEKGGRVRPGAADSPVSTAPAATGAAPATVADPPANEKDSRGARWVGWMLTATALLGMPLVGTIGFAASYATLKQFALSHGFGPTLAGWFPIGIDAAIVAFLAMDLVLVRKGKAMPLLRVAAHTMTLATVVFNASEGLDVQGAGGLWPALSADPLRGLSHAAMPVLFIIGVEALRHLLKHTAEIEEKSDRIPLHRWVLSPWATPRLYRRMRLAGVRSYDEMVEREQALRGYEVWLKQKYAGDLSRATEIERLPMTMAPRGYTVEEALLLPEQWEREAAERARLEVERKSQEAERVQQDARRRAEAERDARIAALNDEAAIAEAQHRAMARTGTAEAEAETQRTLAEQRRIQTERAAQRETEAMESAEAAAARRKAEEDHQAAAVARRQAVEEQAQARRLEADAARLQEQTQAAATRRALDEQRAAQAAEAAATARAQAAQAEAAAQDAEDYARLSPRERNARRVARMLLAAHPHATDVQQIDPKAVPLADIQESLRASRTVAGELRQEAMALIEGGYRGTEVHTA